MALDFNDKILVTNPTAYGLGVGIASAGIIAVALGIITWFTGDIFMPAQIWCAVGIPTLCIGGIFVATALTKP